MKQKLEKETPSVPVNENGSPNILPWIKDKSYLSSEYQRMIKKRVREIYGDRRPGNIRWDLNNKTVI